MVRKTAPLLGADEKKHQSQSRKRSLPDFFQLSSKKKRITNIPRPEYVDLVTHLQTLLPRLEALLKTNESLRDLAKRELREFFERLEEYLDDFDAFNHAHDPV